MMARDGTNMVLGPVIHSDSVGSQQCVAGLDLAFLNAFLNASHILMNSSTLRTFQQVSVALL